MTGNKLLKMSADLERYMASFDGLMGRPENRKHMRRFARGQLGPIKRKSLEPIADAEGVEPRSLQQFFSHCVWEEGVVRDELQKRVAQAYGSEEGIFVIDETSDAKKGEFTAGVSRQYCGESGKVDNCIVTVHTGYVSGGQHALIDGELFLPESWNPDSRQPEIGLKRKRAKVPEHVVHVSKAEMALKQLERAKANGVPGRYVGADEGYGGKPWWRGAVDGLGYVYVVEVPKSTAGWMRKPKFRLPRWKGRGRPPTRREATTRSKTVAEWGRDGKVRWQMPWTRYRVHDTEKGPEVWEVKAGWLWEGGENGPQKAQMLLVARHVLSGEEKYFLCNAPEGTPMEKLLQVAFSRWRIERCFQDCKSDLGLNHAEIRTYRGIHRHLTLTAVNYFFLSEWMRRHAKAGEKRSDGEPVCRWDTEAA